MIEFQFLEEKGSHVNSFQPRDHQFLSHPSEFSSNLGNHLTKEGFPVFENDRKLFFLNHSYTPKYFNKVTLFLKNSSIFPFHRRIDKTGEKSIFHTYNFYTAFSFLLENWKQYNYILFLTKLNLLSISDFNKKMVDEKMENWEEEQSFFLLEEELFSQFRFFLLFQN